MPGISLAELFVLLLIGLATAFWIWMLIECIAKDRDPDRVLWIVVIACTHFIGAALYFVVRRPRRLAASSLSPG